MTIVVSLIAKSLLKGSSWVPIDVPIDMLIDILIDVPIDALISVMSCAKHEIRFIEKGDAYYWPPSTNPHWIVSPPSIGFVIFGFVFFAICHFYDLMDLLLCACS